MIPKKPIMKPIYVDLPMDVREIITAYAKREGHTIQAVVEYSLRKFIEEHNLKLRSKK